MSDPAPMFIIATVNPSNPTEVNLKIESKLGLYETSVSLRFTEEAAMFAETIMEAQNVKQLVDSGPSPDQVALAILDARYSISNGVIHPDTEDQVATADESDAIDVLCDEYDYGYAEKPTTVDPTAFYRLNYSKFIDGDCCRFAERDPLTAETLPELFAEFERSIRPDELHRVRDYFVGYRQDDYNPVIRFDSIEHVHPLPRQGEHKKTFDDIFAKLLKAKEDARLAESARRKAELDAKERETFERLKVKFDPPTQTGESP
jgi:hypothetical protein